MLINLEEPFWMQVALFHGLGTRVKEEEERNGG